ncbi:MAG: carbon-nitrogen family hydrolase [Clostridium sp.]|nr:carbon-nitrogen family hydrolase [Clostridium sp.]
MKIALAQMDILWEDKENNKIKCENFIAQAKEKGADIIAFPEMTLTGFSQNVSKIGDTNNETIDWFKNQSIKYGIYTCFGYVEKCDLKGKNKLAVISPEGKEISSYTKIHPFSYGNEDKFYYKGTDINLFNIGDTVVSTAICYDLRFPEIFQAASKSAELIIVIANWPKSRIDAWITLLKARAIENQCYIAGVNRVGNGDGIEYCGDSMIVDPKGNVLASSRDNEEIIIAEIDTKTVEQIRESFPYKMDRQEDLYIKLFQQNY